MSNELVKQSFSLSAPSQAMEVADILQRFVKEKNLTANIKGKNYPLVEAWQFAGSQLGLYPLLTETKDISNGNEIKYMATVEIRRIENDTLMSRGVAICSNKEGSKRSFDEYAILSMAQTRAEGKAYRMLLSWLMKAAGFEATPAEEMDFAKQPDPDFSDVPAESERELLRQLVYSSDLTDDEKTQTLIAINTIQTYGKYSYIESHLQDRQISIDRIANPSQKDINNHTRKISKQPA